MRVVDLLNVLSRFPGRSEVDVTAGGGMVMLRVVDSRDPANVAALRFEVAAGEDAGGSVGLPTPPAPPENASATDSAVDPPAV